MTQLIIIVGIVLLVAIIFMIMKVNALAEISKDKNQVVSTSNKVNAFLMLTFLIAALALFFWYSVARFDEYTLPVASKHGVDIDRMFWVTTAVTGVAFLLTNILLFFFAFKYRYKENKRADFFPHNNKLEIWWTVVPAIVLAVLIFDGLDNWSKIMSPAPKDAEVIEIVGQQFQWSVRYTGKDKKLGASDYRKIDATNTLGIDFSDKSSFDDFIPRKMYLPVGRPVEFKIRAKDVLHSVFIPHFRLKMDAVPGMPTRFWFVPTKTTKEMRIETKNDDFQYELACTEICGQGHFTMRMLIEVVTPEEYDAWFAKQEPWLSKNKDYLSRVPEALKEVASIKAGISPASN